MSNPVNETSQKEHQRNAGKVQEESADHGLSMAPPPFQLASNPSAPPMDKPSGDGNDGGDGLPMQRKAFNGTPPAKPEESDNNNGSNSNPFQLKASAEASTTQPQNSPSAQPFQLKKGDDQQHESRESFALQRKAGNGGGGGGESGGGGNVMEKMSAAFGQDFSNVKVNQNSEQATKVGALAYTQGNEMHFAPGQFNPGTKGGQELIGHELAHVVQQREGKVKPTTEIAGKAVNDDKGLEADADAKGAAAASKLNAGGGGQNLKTGSASNGVTQAKMAPDIVEKQKNLGDTVDKSQQETKEVESEDADKQAENTSKVQTPEQKVSKQDQENQSMRQKDREKAKDTGTVDPTKNQNPEDKGKESGVQDRKTPDVNGEETHLEGDQQNAETQENEQEENTQQQEQPQSENAEGETAEQENQETTEEPKTETPPVPEAKQEAGQEEKSEGEEESKEGEAEQTQENADPTAQDAQGGAEGQEGQGGGEGGDGKGGGATALGGGGGGGKEGAGGNGGGGGGKVGMKLGGSGDKPEGDFSKSVRKQLYRVPKTKVGTVPKEAIISKNADGSVIAQKVNPALLTAKSQEQPEGLKQAPVQMKPDPTKNNNNGDTITPVPQNQLEEYYGDRDNDNNQLLDQFKQNTGAQLTTFEGLAGDIETKLGSARKKAEGDIRKQTTLIKGRITREHQNAKKRALGEANKTKRILKGWNTTLVANIKKETKGAKSKIQREYDTTMEYLRGMETNIAQLISAEITRGAGEIRAVGTTKGAAAVKIAGDRAAAYAAMPVPSMSGTEEFFNGPTYEQDRHDARVKAANDVGKGYNEQFVQKADEAAKALEGNLPTILQGAQAKITEAIEKVEAKKTAGDKEIEASETSALDGAKQTLTQYEGMVDTQLEGANGQLDSTKTSQLKAAEDQGKNQIKVLDQLHKSAVEGLQNTHRESTESIRTSIQTVIDEVTGMENAEPGKVEVILNSAEKSITESVSNLTTSFNQGITDSIKGYETHSEKAKEALTEVGNGAKEALNQVVTDLRGTLADTEKQAKDANKGVLDGHKDGVEKSATKYVDEIKGLKKDVETGFEAVKKNITAEVKKSVDGLTSEFGTQLGGVHSEITTKAQQAYDAVKPRWKGWVTFIIKLVIAIAVTVAIGLLAASGVGLLAGLGLAFLIGAAGAILETGLIDLLVEQKFSGFGTYFKNAVLGGIGGMFTFLGARWGAGAGKYLEGALGKLGGSLISSNVMSKIGSYIGEVGVGFAMDMVGTFAKEVSGQLYDNIGSVLRGEGWKGINWGEAASKTFTWENIALNFGGNLGGKIFGDILTAKGLGGPGGAIVEWINGKLPRWAMSAEHLAKIDAGGGAGGLDTGGGTGGADVKTGEPEIKTGEPELKTGEPEVKTGEPEIKTNEPEIKTNEPEVKTNEPEVKTNEPEVKTNEPEVKTNEPEVKTNEPEVKTEEPEVKTEEPEVKSNDSEVKTDTEGPTTAGGKKSGAQLAEDLKYPPAPEGYHWANHQGKGVPVLRRNPVKGGSNLIQVQYDPLSGKFIDPNTNQVFNSVAEVNTANAFHTAPKSPVPIPNTPEFTAFKNSANFKGDDQMAAQAFELFQNGKWTELETFIHQNGLNSNWPPNQGFTSIKPETLAPGVQIDRYGHPGGTFVAPAGTPYTQRALPPGTNSKPYNVYEVVKPINVEGGPAIPWFGESGMGVQFKLPMSVQDLINGGYLKLITPP